MCIRDRLYDVRKQQTTLVPLAAQRQKRGRRAHRERNAYSGRTVRRRDHRVDVYKRQVYLFFGGYFATAVSDFIQGIIMFVGVVVMIFYVFNYEKVGGFLEGIAAIGDKREEMGLAMTGTGIWQLVMLVLLTSLGSWGLPQIVHKFHTVKNEAAIKKATWVSTVFALIIGVGAYLVGCTVVLVFGDTAATIPADQRLSLIHI